MKKKSSLNKKESKGTPKEKHKAWLKGARAPVEGIGVGTGFGLAAMAIMHHFDMIRLEFTLHPLARHQHSGF